MSEHTEQVAFLDWCALHAAQYPELRWLYAVPNGGQRDVRVARRMKAEGVKAGVPDLCLPVSRGGYHGLYMEAKVKPNKLTPEQSAWLRFLALQGYAAKVCYGFDELLETVRWYLALEHRHGVETGDQASGV